MLNNHKIQLDSHQMKCKAITRVVRQLKARVNTAKSDDLSLIPRTHTVEEKNGLLLVMLCTPHYCYSTHTTFLVCRIKECYKQVKLLKGLS